MRRRTTFGAGLCGMAMVGAAMLPANGGWEPSPATVITDSAAGKNNLAIGASTNGDAVAVWTQNSASGTAVVASVRDEGTWSAPVTIADGGGTSVVPFVVIDQNGFATAVWSRSITTPETVKTISFATRPAGGSWSAPADLATTNSPERLGVAIAPNGAVSAVWQSTVGVSVADKAAGATTWTTTSLGSGRTPSVATAPDNRVAVAWTSGTQLLAKVRTAAGTWAAAPTENPSTDDPDTEWADEANESVLAFGADGALHTAWWEYDAGSGSPDERIRTSSRTVEGVWTQHPDPISGSDTITHPSGIAADAQGNVTVVWNSVTIGESGGSRILAATRHESAWEAPFALSGEGLQQSLDSANLVVDANGVFTAVWGQNSNAKANRRTAAGDWATTPDTLAPASVGSPTAALDSDGEAMAAWRRFYFQGSAHYTIETRTFDPSEPPTDTIGPVTVTTKPTKPYYLTSTIPVAWTADDALSNVDAARVRFSSAAWNGGYSAYTNLTTFMDAATTFSYTGYTGLAWPGRTYCFQVQSRDDSPTLNEGDWSGDACTATPVDDRRPVRAGSWTRLTGDTFYRGTILRTADKGATLSLTGAQGRRLALVVTTCPGCGKVVVKFAGETLASVSLASPTTKRKVVKPVVLWPELHTGKLVVQVVSANGKRVFIDGILVGRV